MTAESRRSSWLVAAALASFACASSPEPQFYTLLAQRGSTCVTPPLQVELRRPALPSYLDRLQIVRARQSGQLDISGLELWGAPLEDLIANRLVQDLAQRLPSARVFMESGAISSEPDARVEIEIQRFELTERGSVELVAQVAVHASRGDADEPIERYASSRTPSDRNTAHLVTQMSALLGGLADSIAHSLCERAPPPGVGSQRR